MKKLLLGACAVVLMGAGCGLGSDYSFDDYDYDYYDDYDYSVPEGWTADVEAPLTVAVGDEFEVVAMVTNETGEDQMLHSIDIGETYLDGIAVTGSEPDFTDSFLIGDGTYTHTLEVDVPAGESAEVTFMMTALSAGDYSGAFDICTGEGLSCTFLTVRTVVE